MIQPNMIRQLIKDTLRIGLDVGSHLTRHLPRSPAVHLLNYHEVLDGPGAVEDPYNQVSVRSLAAHIDALLGRGFRFVTVSGMMQLLRRNDADIDLTVGLTFDDGLREHAALVLPILQERGVSATFYVLAGAFGARSTLGRKVHHLTKEEVQSLAGAGMEVGSHSSSHPVLSRLGPDQLEREVAGSREDLARILGEPPVTFGYPYGSRRTFDDSVVEAVSRAGYESAVCTVIGANDPDTPRYELRRIPVYGTDGPGTVVARALGAYDWVGRLQETWLRFFPHHSTTRNGS